MFRQRFLTALILVPLVLLAIYYGNIWMLSTVVLVLMVTLGWEWLSLIPVSHLMYQCLFMLSLLIFLIPSMYWLHEYLLMSFVVWGLILVAVLTFPKSQRYWGNRVVVGGACLFILPTFLSSLDALLQFKQGRDLLVYLLFLVWATDIGAYLAGKQWGRHKLIPSVSPGKTWEGASGGFIMAMLVAFGAYFYFHPHDALTWFAIALFIILISMLGDLFISMLKRRCKLKDTGQLLPGHGGVLDRLDSLIAALPFFCFFCKVF
ncbi:MAG: phosphatidate cytidylyltransferase [Legionellaceae bacterium]|nr:phosphatidate cytidylyltransferase [Legionellaceae bacterium]